MFLDYEFVFPICSNWPFLFKAFFSSFLLFQMNFSSYFLTSISQSGCEGMNIFTSTKLFFEMFWIFFYFYRKTLTTNNLPMNFSSASFWLDNYLIKKDCKYRLAYRYKPNLFCLFLKVFWGTFSDCLFTRFYAYEFFKKNIKYLWAAPRMEAFVWALPGVLRTGSECREPDPVMDFPKESHNGRCPK